MSKLNYIDLFAGAGGLSEGFLRSGFEPVAHVEMDAAACNTLRTRVAYHYLKSINKYENYIAYLRGEISRTQLYEQVPRNLLDSVIHIAIGEKNNKQVFNSIDVLLETRKVDLIIGGPPCQAYSLVGRARSENNMDGDPRNYLYVQYARYLEKYQPKMFVFENVIGLKSAKKGRYLKNMESLFIKKGFFMKLFTVEAKNFGVLQSRRRIIIIGWRKNLSIKIPDMESIRSQAGVMVNSIFEDLPKIQAGTGAERFLNYETDTNAYLSNSYIRNGIDILTQHVARPHTDQDKEIYRIAVEKWDINKERLNYNDLPDRLKTHRNRRAFFDRFKVVTQNQSYSHTVVAHIAKDGHYYIHPDIKQNRSITVREAARLQSFPDDYYFEGVKENANRTAAFKQIGNAVPVLLAQRIAEEIRRLLHEA